MNKKVLRNPIARRRANLRKKVSRTKVLQVLSTIMNNQQQQASQQQQQQQPSSQQQQQTDGTKPTLAPSESFEDEFYNSGRIGRRNALPDILRNDHACTATGDLPTTFSALTTNDPDQAGVSGISSTQNQGSNK